MILIVDSGSTKTDWVAISSNNEIQKFETLGLNPEVLRTEELIQRLDNSIEILEIKHLVKSVYFYGSGCGSSKMKNHLREILKEYFNAEIVVKEDTYAAAYATTARNEKSIVCILGTGSNCSYFDGKELHQKIVSLGFLVMDDGGGIQFGRLLLREYYYNKMPNEIADKFKQTYDLNPDFIKHNLYKKPNPNAYLAQIATFILLNKTHPYIQKLIKDEISRFIENQILQFEESNTTPINFIGSLAFYLKDEITEILKNYSLKIGTVYQKPIDGLINYHKNN